MDSSPAAPSRPWLSLGFTALVSLLAQLALCQFFSAGKAVPLSIDVNPSNLWKYAYQFPPRGEFLTLNWLGIPNLPPTLNPFSLAAAHLPAWLFFTAYAPVLATGALLAMALFLRELGLPRPAALFAAVIYAWQGDLLPFVFPGHYGYITTWPFFALAAWGALHAQRTKHWAGSVIAGASCGMMVGLQPDRGSIASLLIAAFYLGPILNRRVPWAVNLRQLTLCAGLALLISLAAFLALFQSYIVGVKLGNSSDREQTFNTATQYSLGPLETLSYAVPGFFGWHNTSDSGPYWGWIGETPGWDKSHQGMRNQNLAISTTGTIATILALLGACLLLPGAPQSLFAGAKLDDRQIYFGRLLLIGGTVALLLSWGYHTPLYRPLFGLPLMDKWRNPLKWLEISNFALISLSGFGVQYLLLSLDPAKSTAIRRSLQFFLATTTALFLVGFLAGYPIAILVAGRLNADGYPPVTIGNAMHTLTVSTGIALILTGLTWLLLIGAWRAEELRQWKIVNPWLRRGWNRILAPDYLPATLAVKLALLAALQLGWVAAQFIQPADLSHLTASNPLIDSLRSEGPTLRAAVPAPQDPLLNFFLQNQFAYFRLSSIDISAASRIPDRLDDFLADFQKNPARLWFLAGVKNVALAQNIVPQLQKDLAVAANIEKADGYTLQGNGVDPSHALVRLRDYLAKATFVPSAEVIPSDDDELKRLIDPTWNPRATILISNPFPTPSTPPTPPSKSAPVPVTITAYTPHEIQLNVNAPTAGYLLINDAYDADWQAEINGSVLVPILQADYILRAIPVDAGEQHIALRYIAHYHLAGQSLPVLATNLVCDVIMLASWLIACVALWRKKVLRAIRS